MVGFVKENVEFNAEGCILRGWFYRPKVAGKFPAVVMAHGWNVLKEHYLDRYAEVLVKQGIGVFVYDHRNFGESEGAIRQEIDPWQQVRDYRHAISYVETLPEVDAERIGVWGTSYSGGHVLVVAALDRRVKCVVSQVPTISGYQTMRRRYAPHAWPKLQQRFIEDRRARFAGKPEERVTTIATEQNAMSSHPDPDALAFFSGSNAPAEEQWRFKNWRNEVTLRSLEMYSEYEPGSYISRISPTPLLMITVTEDTVSQTDLHLRAYEEALEPKKLVMFEGHHFSPYVDKFVESATAAAEWFAEHLQKV